MRTCVTPRRMRRLQVSTRGQTVCSRAVWHSMTDTMEKWDEEKLRSVVLSKTGNPKTTTDVSVSCGVGRSCLTLFSADRVQILHPGYRRSEIRVVVSADDQRRPTDCH